MTVARVPVIRVSSWVIGSGIVTGIIVTRSVRRAWVIVTGSVIVTWIQVTGSAVISAVVTSVDRGQTQNSEENQYLHCVIYPILIPGLTVTNELQSVSLLLYRDYVMSRS